MRGAVAGLTSLKGRYELKEVLGRGGMGLVYRAFDSRLRRDVALKTIRDAPSRAALQLFRRECDVLASISHPNIVEIFDIGEFQEQGENKPYFVMPLLRGFTLEQIIRDSAQRLTQERLIEIACHTCRGLQAAHEHGLVHRDLKPSNIFVMQDDSVKIIDFGVAHMAAAGATLSIKGGTLQYMAPEQVQMQAASPRSDIFSLGVVCYETLSRRKPFEGSNEVEIARAILHHIPPPVSELNASVSPPLSRVIHKSMAKQPWHRFDSAREFGEVLRKAAANEPIAIFDSARIGARLQRSAKAFAEGNLQFAAEILNELEAEGYFDSAIPGLRRQIDNAVRRQTVTQLIETARARAEQEEYLLALQKLEEALQLDPENFTAKTLKGEIENKRSEHKIDEWLKLSRQHLANRAFAHARNAIESVLKLKPKDSGGLQLLSEIARQEEEFLRIRHEKELLYNGALDAWHNGEMSVAVSKLERLIELDRRAPDTSADRGVAYQNLFNQVRSEYDAVQAASAEVRRLSADGDFPAGLAICDEYLQKYPAHAVFQALRFDIEDRQRQERSACIAQVDRQIEAEPDVDRRLSILNEAVKKYPDEPHFERLLRRTKEKQQFVRTVVTKARSYEQNGQLNEALGQWQILQTVHSEYPGLQFEIERIHRRREQQLRDETKYREIEQIRNFVIARDFGKALEAGQAALEEFPHDQQIDELMAAARQGLKEADEAQGIITRARELRQQGLIDDALDLLRSGFAVQGQNSELRHLLIQMLLEKGRQLIESSDFSEAGQKLVAYALELDPGNVLARNLYSLFVDRRREAAVTSCMSDARALESSGDPRAAIGRIDETLQSYSHDPILLDFRTGLIARIGSQERERQEQLTRLQSAVTVLEEAGDVNAAWSEAESALTIFPDDLVLIRSKERLQRRRAEVNRRRLSHPNALEDTGQKASDEALAPGKFDRRERGIAGTWVPLQSLVNMLVRASAGSMRRLRSLLGQKPRSDQPTSWRDDLVVIAGSLVLTLVIALITYQQLKKPPVFRGASPLPKETPGPSTPVYPPDAPLGATTKPVPEYRAPGGRSETPTAYDVSITTNPPEARVEIDRATKSQQTCVSPCNLKLNAGRHDLLASLPGYRAGRKIFHTPPQNELTLMLERESGVVVVSTIKPGASIFLNGNELKEKTPAILSVAPGDYTLLIVIDGVQTEKTFTIQHGERLSFSEAGRQ